MVNFGSCYFYSGAQGECNFFKKFLFLADPLRTPLDWRTRLQIASGVVAALVSVIN